MAGGIMSNCLASQNGLFDFIELEHDMDMGMVSNKKIKMNQLKTKYGTIEDDVGQNFNCISIFKRILRMRLRIDVLFF